MSGQGERSRYTSWMACACGGGVCRAASKPALVRGLWRDHRRNPRAVRLIAQLMLDYTVPDSSLWVAVVTALRANGQHRAVLAILRALSRPAWLSVLSAAFWHDPKLVSCVDGVRRP